MSANKVLGPINLRTTVPKWAKLAKLWFTGEEKWKASGYTACTIALALTTTALLVRISYVQRDFSTALSGKNAEGFYHAIWQFVGIICLAAPLFSFSKFVEDRLVLAWRAYLTRYFLRAYFKDKAFFRLGLNSGNSQEAPSGFPPNVSAKHTSASTAASSDSSSSNVDNPDQRICDDVGAFVSSSTTITLALCKKIFNCAAFASVLWSVSGQLVVLMFVYAGVGTIVTTSVFGKILMRLYYTLLAFEGDMRYALVRVRESAESIALYGGEEAEARMVHGRLAAVLTAAATRIRFSGYYDLWTSIYQYATILAPSLLTAPRYFAGEIEFGTISQTSFAFSSISQALSIIITNLGQITGLAAETDRLYALLTALELHHQSAEGDQALVPTIERVLSPKVDGLALYDLTVNLPGRSDTTICKDLSLKLEPGQSLLIVGASGCGKSSLLRALAGLWTQGSGVITMPSRSFFLPQKPFMPLGSLRHQLLFPSAEDVDVDNDGGTSLSMRSAGSKPQPDPEHAPLLPTASQTPTHPPATPPSLHMYPTSAYPSRGGDLHAGGTATVCVTSSGLGGGRGLVGKLARDAKSSTLELSHTEVLCRKGASGGGSGSGCYGPMLSDVELHELLEDVRLENLAAKVGGLDAQCDWSQLLSSGEQQRVAILRLLAHSPQMAFLDEATSAVDGQLEATLYSLLRARCPCYVSSGHRMQLLNYHTHVLDFKEDSSGGGKSSTPQWVLCTAQEFRHKLNQAAGANGFSIG